MAKKFFCGSCGHEVVHEVFEEGNCLSCRILLSRKLRSMSEGREPVSYSKDTQTPPDGNGDMHKFIRALLLRRPDAAIDKAVKENRWKDAYELEVKYHMEAAVSITSDARVRLYIVGSSPCGVPGPEIISITVPDIAGCRPDC